jgi:hypothetical protein
MKTDRFPEGMLVEVSYMADTRMASGEMKPLRKFFLGKVTEYTDAGLARVSVTSRGNVTNVEPKKTYALARSYTVTPICPEHVYREFGSGMPLCARPLKKPEQIEARKCGIHLGVQRRSEKAAAERRQSIEQKNREQDEAQEFVDRFNEACAVDARPGGTYERGQVMLTREDATKLMVLVAKLQHGDAS